MRLVGDLPGQAHFCFAVRRFYCFTVYFVMMELERELIQRFGAALVDQVSDNIVAVDLLALPAVAPIVLSHQVVQFVELVLAGIERCFDCQLLTVLL